MFAGIDIGSRVTKTAILKDNKILSYSIIDSCSDPEKAAKWSMEEALSKSRLSWDEITYIVATGYGRVAFKKANKIVTELTCHARGAHFFYPTVRTVIDIGGQDSKVIQVDEIGNMIDFAMNDKCAAGTGRFLEIVSHILEIPIEEMGNFSLSSTYPLHLSSTCAVFAETEVISLLASKQKKEDIAAGVHSAIARRVGNMVKSFGTKEDIVFVGGVAKNEGVKRALERFLDKNFVPVRSDPQIIGAIGAALLAKDFFEKKESL
jgi:predicted CoA-substrate-specific enzyme activase